MAKDEKTILDAEETVLDADTVDATLPDDVATMPDDATVLDDEVASNDGSCAPIIEKGASLLDTYRIESDAIEGGMGAVWRVHHTGWNVDLAIKRPKASLFQSEKQKENFVHECEAWINIGLHPHIVSCYYVRDIAGVPSIFSEWMDGGSLKNAIEDGRLYEGDASERILDIAIQFARGLHYAHEHKDPTGKPVCLIHRDVKPGNLLLLKSGLCKVSDFGIAVSLRRREKDQSTEDYNSGFTPAYASPEQMVGELPTKRTDIYSWAVCVLEMYLGERLWQIGTVASEAFDYYITILKVAMPESVKNLLSECLCCDPKKRPNGFHKILPVLCKAFKDETGAEYPLEENTEVDASAGHLNNLALSLYGIKRYDEAADHWRNALLRFPGHWESTLNYTLFLYETGTIGSEEANSLLCQLSLLHGNKQVITFSNASLPWALCKVQDYRDIGAQSIERQRIADTIKHAMSERRFDDAVALYNDGVMSPAFSASRACLEAELDITRIANRSLESMSGSYVLRHHWKPEAYCFSESANLLFCSKKGPVSILSDMPTLLLADRPWQMHTDNLEMAARIWPLWDQYSYTPICISARFTEKSCYIATRRSDGCVAVFDTNVSVEPIIISANADKYLDGTCFCESSRKLIVFRRGCAPMIFDFSKQKVEGYIGKAKQYPLIMDTPTIIPGERLFAYSTGNETELRNIETGKLYDTLPGRLICVSPNGRYLLLKNGELSAVLFQQGQAQPIYVDHGHRMVCAAFLPDARQAIWLREDRSLMLIHADGPEEPVKVCERLDTEQFYITEKGLRFWDQFGNYCFAPMKFSYSRPSADWDADAEAFVNIFLSSQPKFNFVDREALIGELQYRGYGWISSESMCSKLEKMASSKKGLFGRVKN